MDKKLRETTNLCVEIMNSITTLVNDKERGNLATWYKFAFDVNVKRNLSYEWARLRQIKHRAFFLANGTGGLVTWLFPPMPFAGRRFNERRTSHRSFLFGGNAIT